MRSTGGTSSPLDCIQKAVHGLMTRHGVSPRQHSNKLAEILALSYSQAHRILNGGDWTILQLSSVAEHFGENLRSLLVGPETPVVISLGPDKESREADFIIGEHHLPCRVTLGAQLFHPPRNVDYVALETPDGLEIVASDLCPEHAKKFKIERIEISIRQPNAPAIAVVDDEKPSADNLRDYLNDCGFQATAFYDSVALEKANQERKFDGYVIDWILGEQTSESLIQQIRTSVNPSASIILLTGQYDSSRMNVSEVARVVRQFDVVYQEKPTRSPVIAAELSKACDC
ncbi:response regulator [Duganella sp. FT80W]|uniref:Response regulator n=1 Tax=Duganella guangzhouensis TaxID=2666084 RepID=A0A6I2KWB7_9BURK|nr:helix-turn-helix domain-containing protein [Duganella guangzhouensis]MRW90051.1 response regulator [Duganella guangzhouensis]